MDKVTRQCPQTTTYTDERISIDFSAASSEFSAGTAARNTTPLPQPHTHLSFISVKSSRSALPAVANEVA